MVTLWQPVLTVASLIPICAKSSASNPRVRCEPAVSIGTRSRTRPGIEWMMWVMARGPSSSAKIERFVLNYGQVVAASLDRHIGIVHVMPGHLYDLVRPRG